MALAASLTGVEVAMMCPASDVETNWSHLLAEYGAGRGAERRGSRGRPYLGVCTLRTAGQQRVVAFNSDSPHLPPSVLESAFEVLATHDVVVGPTHDGGYYLVGAKAAHPGLFDGDRYGHEECA